VIGGESSSCGSETVSDSVNEFEEDEDKQVWTYEEEVWSYPNR
jgi:hypothetical protein